MTGPDPQALTELDPVVIIGTGLVGASVGCALTNAGVRVHLQDRVPAHAQVAAGIGAGTTAPAVADTVALVVVAVPPQALAGAIEQALVDHPNAVVTDVGSVKGVVQDELTAAGVDMSRYVGSHPMAGSHLAGPVTAHAELFRDRTWVVCAHNASTPASIQTAIALGELCGAKVIQMDPHAHDEAVAAISHVPHLVSVTVAAGLTGESAESLQLAGQGVRDVTRIAGSDPQLWSQILAANAPAISGRLRQVAGRLEAAATALEQGRDLVPQLRDGVSGTRALPGKHGRRRAEYAQFTVPIPDAPGALARLFADADVAGVNIEDFSIEHDPHQRSGWLSVSVDPEEAATFAVTMAGRGWDLQPV